MSSDHQEWELTHENAHPRARQLLTLPFFWSVADDNAPFGNDTGADTLEFYREWRMENPAAQVQAFVDDTLSAWGVEDGDWWLLEERTLEQLLEKDHFSVLMRDDFMIALAFAQLVLHGSIDPQVLELARLSVRRQATEAVVVFRGWTDAAERKSRLAQMLTVLEAV